MDRAVCCGETPTSFISSRWVVSGYNTELKKLSEVNRKGSEDIDRIEHTP